MLHAITRDENLHIWYAAPFTFFALFFPTFKITFYSTMPEKNTNMNLLMEFLQDNGVIWDKELVEVLPACMNPDLSDTTYACYAIKDCKEGDVSE